MNTKNFMAFIGIVSFFNGIALVIVPEAVLAPLGMQPDATGLMLARFWGAFATGAGVLAWQVRAMDFNAMRPALWNLLIFFVVATVLDIWSINTGIFNALGWVVVAVDLVLAIAFGYLLYPRRTMVEA